MTCRLTAAAAALTAVGRSAHLAVLARDGDHPVGAVTSSTPPLSPGHPGLALAPLARAVEVGATVMVESVEGWVPAGVVEPPFVGHGQA